MSCGLICRFLHSARDKSLLGFTQRNSLGAVSYCTKPALKVKMKLFAQNHVNMFVVYVYVLGQI